MGNGLHVTEEMHVVEQVHVMGSHQPLNLAGQSGQPGYASEMWEIYGQMWEVYVMHCSVLFCDLQIPQMNVGYCQRSMQENRVA
jgi:hypothetical protein